MTESLATCALLTLAAVLLDGWLGEPRRWHPLAGFGRLAARLETACHADTRMRGAIVLALMLLPPTLLAWGIGFGLRHLPGNIGGWLHAAFSIWALTFALGHRSLYDHAQPIVTALQAGDHDMARRLTARIVSRDAEALDIVPAACETVLENGNDAVFGALFWFICLGAPGAILFRLANTLDAMWGYKNPRYLKFGWAAARFDDLLNGLPAQLTALTYAVLGDTRAALRCWRSQAPAWESPNAGPVMAAGAGALGVRLGGAARYRGTWQARPPLGAGKPPVAGDIERALALVTDGVLLWLTLLLLAGALHA